MIEYHESGNLGKNFYRDHQEIIEMTIPDGIKRIGESCFENCRNLRRIVIPDSVVGIHKRAFYGCESLEEVCIPDNLQNIAEDVFSGCVNLKQVTLPAGTRYVSNHAFAGCTSLQKVAIENNEIRISQTAFEGCTSLEFENALLLAEHFVKPLNILIHNGANGIEGHLRTFADRRFWFDGVECASIESVLEALKNAVVKSKVGSWNPEGTALTKSEYISHLLYFSGGSCSQEVQPSVREANDILIQPVLPIS